VALVVVLLLSLLPSRLSSCPITEGDVPGIDSDELNLDRCYLSSNTSGWLNGTVVKCAMQI